jgi:hypothetical protein
MRSIAARSAFASMRLRIHHGKCQRSRASERRDDIESSAMATITSAM